MSRRTASVAIVVLALLGAVSLGVVYRTTLGPAGGSPRPPAQVGAVAGLALVVAIGALGYVIGRLE